MWVQHNENPIPRLQNLLSQLLIYRWLIRFRIQSKISVKSWRMTDIPAVIGEQRGVTETATAEQGTMWEVTTAMRRMRKDLTATCSKTSTVMLETTANERQSEECLTECKKQGKPCFWLTKFAQCFILNLRIFIWCATWCDINGCNRWKIAIMFPSTNAKVGGSSPSWRTTLKTLKFQRLRRFLLP